MIERYVTPEMEGLFSDESRFQSYLAVEIAALEAWGAIGLIPAADISKIKIGAKVNVARIKELEAVTKHDVVAFTRQISETLGEERKWVHYGLTSTDVVDTALGLLYKQADEAIARHFLLLIEAVKAKALQYKDLPCVGRTHGMHAEITSFGLKWANWFDELSRDYADFSSKRQLIECCKMSGSLGNYANIDPRIQESVAASLGLSSAPIATQVLSRDRHAAYGATLAIAASAIEKMAVEIRNLSRTEIGEVEEGFLEGQIGSSSMPQKRNPVSSENLTGCARLMRGYLFPLLEDNALYHERDISHSSVERVALIDMIELFDHMLCLMADIVHGLRVYPESMRRNIGLTKGAIHAQRVLTALLGKGLDRETAYALIQPLAMAAAQGGDDFASALAKNPQIAKLFSPAELNALFDEGSYLRNVDFIYRRLGLIK